MASASVKKLIPPAIRQRLRAVRERLPVLLEPIDYAGRVINGKGDLPPRHLRVISGPLRDFEASSAQVIAYLNATCGIRPGDGVLDIGCGCGATALQLIGYFSGPGGYTGVDIHRRSIDWAQRHLCHRDSHLRFVWIDVKNPAYNPRGSKDAATFKFDFPDGRFDLVIAKSLFTHLRPTEVENYIGEIGRLLIPGGHGLLTFFLIADSKAELGTRTSSTFVHGAGPWRYADENLPEAACGYDEEYVRSELKRNRLVIDRIIYGHQDILVVSRATSS
jgi:SAM-dependent methyltransferase